MPTFYYYLIFLIVINIYEEQNFSFYSFKMLV
jgi:hypothetical protein